MNTTKVSFFYGKDDKDDANADYDIFILLRIYNTQAMYTPLCVALQHFLGQKLRYGHSATDAIPYAHRVRFLNFFSSSASATSPHDGRMRWYEDFVLRPLPSAQVAICASWTVGCDA